MDEIESVPCPLCGREMVPGHESVNEHHLIPKTFKGREKFPIHRICHSKIHSVFTERELLTYFHTWDRLRSHETIQKFVHWVAKKPPTYVGRNRTSREKGRRRR